MKKQINIIVAIGRQNQIGLNGSMPWKLSDDLKNFRRITTDHIVIMGRKTYDSIGKPLSKRLNYIITGNFGRRAKCGAWLFKSIEDALKKAQTFNKEIFIIGGASIYEQTLDTANRLIVTHVDYEGKADTFFPKINYDEWKIVDEKHFQKNNKNEYDFRVVTYVRKKNKS